MVAQLIKFAADTSCTAAGFCTNLPGAQATSSNLRSLIQIVLGTLAAVAVLIIVIAGLNFVTAEGDPQKVARARSAILYALIGLVVAVSAELVVTFVLGKV